MHNTEPVLENETHKISLRCWGTNWSLNAGQKTRWNNNKQKKKKKKKKEKKKEKVNLQYRELYHPSWPHREIKESEKWDYYLNVFRELRKLEHEGGGNTSYNKLTWNSPQRQEKGTGRVVNKRRNRDYPEYSIIEISQNTKKGPEDLGRIAVTQTPLKNHLLMGKNRKEYNPYNGRLHWKPPVSTGVKNSRC